jgi:hypothetical protein
LLYRRAADAPNPPELMAKRAYGGTDMKILVGAIACVLALASAPFAAAQTDDRYPNSPSAGGQQSSSNGSSFFSGLEEPVLQRLSEKKFGMVVIDATVNGRSCGATRIVVARKGDEQLQPVAAADGSRSLFGTQIKFAGAMFLTPGPYLVTRVVCSNYTNYVLEGPFAQFYVNGGEIVNVGVLSLYTHSGGAFRIGTVSANGVTGLNPEAHVRIKEKFPRIHARMVQRYMTLVAVTRPPPGANPANAAPKPLSPDQVR